MEKIRTMTDLGTFVRDARLRLRMPNGRPMSQEALAAATGVSGATISHIESGKMRRPERDTLEALAAALGVTYNELAYAAGYADPPAERDVESEMRRIATLPTTEERMSELKRSLPLVYEYVVAWGYDLVRQAGERDTEAKRQAPSDTSPGHRNKPGDGHQAV
jgi:transcriptional regulator with XRE-family HTH domain